MLYVVHGIDFDGCLLDVDRRADEMFGVVLANFSTEGCVMCFIHYLLPSFPFNFSFCCEMQF